MFSFFYDHIYTDIPIIILHGFYISISIVILNYSINGKIN